MAVHESRVEGAVEAPPSKSYTHRGLFIAALAEGCSRLMGPLRSLDTLASRRVLRRMGARIKGDGESWIVEGGSLRAPPLLHCGESATTLRFATALAALLGGSATLTGGGSLLRRPMTPLLEALRRLGARCRSRGGYPPVHVEGGSLRGGGISVEGLISSQFISALLIIAPHLEEGLTLRVSTPLVSRPYVALTIEVQRLFGVETYASSDLRLLEVEAGRYRPTALSVEGDWSSASLLLAAGALAGKVKVRGLNPLSLQGDRRILEILREMGAEVRISGRSIAIYGSSLSGVEVNLSQTPDLFPVVASLAAAAEGRSLIHGVDHLRYKESNRLEAMLSALRAMGVEARIEGSTFTVEGGRPRGGVIDPRGDHRIAMALAILALRADGETIILDAECVSKSYPSFWRHLRILGAEVEER